ncbi:glycosyltransferase family 2 protein [Rhodovulum strictum]|uniref:Glycosyltransferase family 2 protein n=1 Tax=Rhodovulum strictum TaxID=58314 RepID=A0A844B109_9RHOB|nr:glycosyltransferase family 2 protein [Rhodovulum strictum]MRH19811.1 glycosyltransferase family 2 protein [Rhodovulum strictum]
MRWMRRRLLFRALRKCGQLAAVADRTGAIRPNDILCFATVRNEAERLPYFLDHHRGQGVAHFLIVDNDSTDGTRDLLTARPDVSLWRTGHSYRLSRFGMDWLAWLMIRHGHGHWCLTLDADELLVYPHHDTRDLRDLTAWLDAARRPSFGAIMLDLYPKGPLADRSYQPGQNPLDVIDWFDAGNIVTKYQPPQRNLLVRGGVRRRVFFAAEPERAPTLSKTPLIRWNRRYVYVSSTHSALPTHLNRVRGRAAGDVPSGVLLHTKFLPSIVAKSREEKRRREHFANSSLYEDYYDALIGNPDLWSPTSTRYQGWRQLEALGIMSRGRWD